MRALSMILMLLALPAAALEISSGERRTVLLELYTSQGCSSCPPADAWLSDLKDDPRLWKELVPLALHVDYWDGLGWRDRFASPGHSQRQRRYRAAGHLRSVYTPGFVVQGREWRGWFRGRPLATDLRERAGVLSARVQGPRMRVLFRPATEPQDRLTAHAALLGFGLATPVARGENAGSTLAEDFVVLAQSQARLTPGPGGLTAELATPRSADHDSRRLALALWVSAGRDPTPVQAAGGWYEPAAP